MCRSSREEKHDQRSISGSQRSAFSLASASARIRRGARLAGGRRQLADLLTTAAATPFRSPLVLEGRVRVLQRDCAREAPERLVSRRQSRISQIAAGAAGWSGSNDVGRLARIEPVEKPVGLSRDPVRIASIRRGVNALRPRRDPGVVWRGEKTSTAEIPAGRLQAFRRCRRCERRVGGSRTLIGCGLPCPGNRSTCSTPRNPTPPRAQRDTSAATPARAGFQREGVGIPATLIGQQRGLSKRVRRLCFGRHGHRALLSLRLVLASTFTASNPDGSPADRRARGRHPSTVTGMRRASQLPAQVVGWSLGR